MDSTIKKIIEETGVKGVKDIIYNISKKKWVIIYEKESYTREFDFFDDIYEYLTTTGQNK